MRPASKFGLENVTETIELTKEEMSMQKCVRDSWKGILNREISDETDFFKSGAGSMDVVRSVLWVGPGIIIFPSSCDNMVGARESELSSAAAVLCRFRSK